MKRTVKDVALAGKRVLMRADFNVPLDGSGAITDDTRIRETLPTVQHILQQGGRLVLLSHLGRPDGTRNPAYSLAPVATRLGELLKRPVQFVEDCLGPEVEQRAGALKPGEVLLLENVRFHPEEEKNDPAFAKHLAGWASCMSTTPSGRLTGPMPPPRGSAVCCRASPGC
ncbi:MAG: phosphoglycerate kinase [Candidatus Omnitrophica bacterium]|nr:phosphoglycerate kinase [Candidatus Omnitrophota bacterium]